MKILMIMLSGVLLVNNQKNIDKKQFEAITGTKVVAQGKVPVVAKKNTTKKKSTATSGQKKKKIKKSTVKKTKKNVKKKVIKKKTKKKTIKKKVYRQTTKVAYNKSEVQNYAHNLVLSYGWSEYDFECLVKLWNRESSWNLNAVNKKSGACGIPQSLPCSKMKVEGSDYRTNYKTQIRWGLKYIKNRYGNPSNAWKHSQRTGWY